MILGTKIGMTQIFKDDGTAVPVTVVQAGPVTVTQVKTEEKDGYSAIQIGYGKKRKVSKPMEGHLKGLENYRYLREFRFSGEDKESEDLKRGVNMDVSIFKEGDEVRVSGISKAKGFQGVVKRHNFAGFPASHGHKGMTRSPGSIGQRFPQHTLKGMRMAGRMGGERTSVRGLKIISVDKDKNILTIKGAVPGRRGTLLEIIKL